MGSSNWRPWYVFLTVTMAFTGMALGIKCWHCISEDCHLDPSENYKAVEKQCLSGQYCQKVYYSMYSTMDNRIYDSTVRGCAWNCLPKNDFQNCSTELHGSRGCVVRNCCRDNDLCNEGSRTNVLATSLHFLYMFVFFLCSSHAT
uniref:Uncharacterized protein LOC111115075 isoform X2 n=1 Tax=Crassostrea virginica TaxID=6565 RepID=A0A8B8C1B4_CRAVI|nr:uncharacterized protein LOC111115075 isoform X2 [Crassostrea virginica]